MEVLRDGEVVHTHQADKESAEARFHWDDPAPKKQEKASYYYVRVVQKDATNGVVIADLGERNGLSQGSGIVARTF